MDISHNIQINATAEKVYNAVATTKGISSWWSQDCVVGESEGNTSLLKFNKEGTIVEMGFQTETLVPNKKVVWECTENANPAWLKTKIVTEISQSENGCNVIFSHVDFDDKWKGQDPFEMTKQGWEHFVKSLVSYCEKGDGQPW
ncbi:MAG: SRPBCC domain-containing protein [Bacteroidota bacterium]